MVSTQVISVDHALVQAPPQAVHTPRSTRSYRSFARRGGGVADMRGALQCCAGSRFDELSETLLLQRAMKIT